MNFPCIIHILHGITHTARTGSVYITMAITIERYFATVHPFKRFEAKKILLIGACLFAIIYNIPKVSAFLKLCQYSLLDFYPIFRL